MIKNVKIGHKVMIKGGKRLPKGRDVVDIDTGFPYIRVKDLEFDRLNPIDIKYITYDVFEKIKNYVIFENEVYISIAGTIGRVGKIPSFLNGANLTENCAKFTNFSEDLDSNYLMYYLRSYKGQGQISGKTGGASQPKLAITRIAEIEIPLPEITTQRKIASILSAYDYLIENNLRRVKLLEEKALLMFKGILMVEKLSRIKLNEIAVVNQSTLKGNSTLEKLLYIDISSVSTASINSKTEYDLREAPGRAKRILQHEDIIWSCVRPNRKSYSFVWKPENNLIASTGFAVITAKKIPSTFLYQLITTQEFVDYLESHAKGATYPAVTATDFEEAFFNIPSELAMQEYHENIYPCFELKHILEIQNKKLCEARDILLPRLMNGEISV